jgi:hypothetical protein
VSHYCYINFATIGRKLFYILAKHIKPKHVCAQVIKKTKCTERDTIYSNIMTNREEWINNLQQIEFQSWRTSFSHCNTTSVLGLARASMTTMMFVNISAKLSLLIVRASPSILNMFHTSFYFLVVGWSGVNDAMISCCEEDATWWRGYKV